ncbi:monoterpene epsilon-lactone hydrolase [Rhodococcus sp. 27YEA15]|uniref:alpha/beta hydrolase n=1 Tax=Rhodococcus sp. 27YEA15 TaxID=3156259 RepID=UPI003C7976E6
MSTFTLPLPVVGFLLRPYFRLAFDVHLPYRLQRLLLEAGAPLQRIPAGAVVRPLELACRPAEKVTVGATERPTAVLYLHGGAYTLGSPRTHRSLAAHLARESSAAVFTLDYRLAPENPYPAALDDAVAAYMQLTTEFGYAPEQLAIAGDSAGGGLAVATALRLVERHGITPGALALISPWVNPGDRNPSRKADLVVNTAWSFDAADAYLGGADPRESGYAPIFGNLEVLPRTRIHVGTDEVLYPQVMDFTDKLAAVGVEVSLVEYAKLWHVAHAQASLVREAAEAVADLGHFLATVLARTPENVSSETQHY